MKLDPTVVVVLGVALAVLALILAGPGARVGAQLPLPGYGVIGLGPAGLLAAGLLVGGVIGAVLFGAASPRSGGSLEGPPPPPGPALSARGLGAISASVILALITLCDSAVRANALEPLSAGLVLVFGALALVAFVAAVDLVQRGQGVEFESRWGGLGGGLGGWRLSPVAVLIAIGLLFAIAAAAAARPPTLAKDRDVTTPPATAKQPAH